MHIRFLTAGESHGQALAGIIEGIPAGLSISAIDIDTDLRRRQLGYGRGNRMKIESDRVKILSGVRFGRTIGSPITILIQNKDWPNWQDTMSSEITSVSQKTKKLTRPRPGHADLSGALKFDTHDIRDILERSSARETAMRTALGAIAKKFLSEFDVNIGSYVTQIGGIKIKETKIAASERELSETFKKAEKSELRCADKKISKEMIKLIDKAEKEGNTLGGIFEVFVTNLPPGIGNHTQWDKKLDGRLAQALMSVQAVKGVEIGKGFMMSSEMGSEVMDEIFYSKKKFYRKTNNAGGIEGGMTNGMSLIIRAAMKPIPTLRKPLSSVDIITKKTFKAAYERSDVCAVPAAGVVSEAMTALVIADAFLEKFGGDSLSEVKRNYNSYLKQLSNF
ncbi:MAG: chorismate synthase [Nitrospiraceae bacterium]|nr:chorismate synthase [Nitrospiraceae bacterium]